MEFTKENLLKNIKKVNSELNIQILVSDEIYHSYSLNRRIVSRTRENFNKKSKSTIIVGNCVNSKMEFIDSILHDLGSVLHRKLS